jgi:transcriptional regulator with XRE-family HTH domain
MDNTTRTFRLRNVLGESQEAFALRLRTSQGTIWRLEAGQRETGPQSMILDRIEHDISEGLIGPSTSNLPGPGGEATPASARGPDSASSASHADGAAFPSCAEVPA